MKGWISVIKNPAIPDMIKISRSDDDPDVLLKKLDAAGGAPAPYQVIYRIYVSNSFLILQNIRRSLLTWHIGGVSGWYSLTDTEGITIVRVEISRYIIDRFRMTIQKGEGNADMMTMMMIIDATLLLSENIYYERNSNEEATAIALVTAAILKNEDWLQDGAWVNRVTLNNPMFAINN